MENTSFTVTSNKAVYDFVLKIGDATFTFNVTAESEASARVKLADMLEKMSVALKSA